MTKYQAVIFDFDDTLVKSWETIWAQHKFVAKTYYGIELSDDVLTEHWGKPFEQLLKGLFKDADTFENMLEIYQATDQDFQKVAFEQSLATINKLLAAGIRIGIVTSMLRDVVSAEMKRLNFPVGKFVTIQGSNDSIYHKPDPRVFEPTLKALAKIGITDLTKIMYVGDALMDYFAARDAGIAFVAITTGRHGFEDFSRAGTKNVVQDISELSKRVL